MRKDDIAKLEPGTAMFAKTGKSGSDWDVVLVDPKPIKHRGVWLVKVRLLEKPERGYWRQPEIWEIGDDGVVSWPTRRSDAWVPGKECYIATRVLFDHEGEPARIQAAAEERRKAREAREKRESEISANAAASEQQIRNQLLVGEKVRYSARRSIKVESSEPDVVERLMLVGVKKVFVEIELDEDGNFRSGDDD